MGSPAQPEGHAGALAVTSIVERGTVLTRKHLVDGVTPGIEGVTLPSDPEVMAVSPDSVTLIADPDQTLALARAADAAPLRVVVP